MALFYQERTTGIFAVNFARHRRSPAGFPYSKSRRIGYYYPYQTRHCAKAAISLELLQGISAGFNAFDQESRYRRLILKFCRHIDFFFAPGTAKLALCAKQQCAGSLS
jgi:hypothetical protein